MCGGCKTADTRRRRWAWATHAGDEVLLEQAGAGRAQLERCLHDTVENYVVGRCDGFFRAGVVRHAAATVVSAGDCGGD